jgi:hypothetical protein
VFFRFVDARETGASDDADADADADADVSKNKIGRELHLNKIWEVKKSQKERFAF